jgi:small conductance mechanosensitive channel
MPLRRWRAGFVGIAALLFATLAIVTAPAQAAGQPAPAAAAISPAKASVDDLKHLLATLQDDKQRAALIQQIQALISVQEAQDHHPGTTTAAVSLVKDIANHFRELLTELGAAEGTIINAPILLSWFRAGMADPETRRFWFAITEKLVIILAAALTADWLVRAGCDRLRRASLRWQGPRWYARAALLLVRLLLDLLPPLAFAGVALAMLPFVHARDVTTGVTTTAIQAVLMARLLIVAARTLLITPRELAWKFPPISEESATYLFIWTRRFVNLSVYGFSIGDAVAVLDVPDPVVETLDKLVALLVTLLAIVFVIQNRQPVAHWLRPRRGEPVPETDVSGDAEAGDAATDGATPIAMLTPRHPFVDFLRHRIADIWHGLAVTYIIGIYLVYALKIEGGFSFLFRASLLTIAAVAVARLAIQGVRQIAKRGFAVPEDMARRYPTLEARANRYVPILTTVVIIAIRLFVLVTLFEIWGIRAYGWFNSTLGEQVTGKLFDIGVIVVVAFLVWEAMNAAIDRYLESVGPDGTRIARSARMRTLLPLLRNAGFFVLLLIAGLLVFSELGINIAPLLAGAGVVGLAVGFGSQALVKDIITGLFMVIENTIAVGDLVDLGGRAGIVEAITIRTIRLRDIEGAVHTIPFSDVSTVKNRSKEFAHHMIALTVARGTDIEKTLGIMQSVGDALKEDATVGPLMLTSIDLWGISAFDSNGITLQGRIKTLPLKNSAVGAEYYRRLDLALTEAGIALPSSQRIISFGEGVGEMLERLRPAAPQAAATGPAPSPNP